MQRCLPSSSVLVVVDVQEKLIGAVPEEGAQALLRGLRILVGAAAELRVPVVLTEQYPNGLGETVGAVAEAVASVGVEPIQKLAFSALGEPAVRARIEALAPKTAIVAGIEAHVCVFQTVRDLVDMGIDVYVPADAVASRRNHDRDVGLSLCERAGAHRTTSETVVFDWLERAGTESFRAIAKLVR